MAHHHRTLEDNPNIFPSQISADANQIYFTTSTYGSAIILHTRGKKDSPLLSFSQGESGGAITFLLSYGGGAFTQS